MDQLNPRSDTNDDTAAAAAGPTSPPTLHVPRPNEAAALVQASSRALDTGDHSTGLAQARSALAAVCDERERAQALTLVAAHAWRLGDLAASYEAGHEAGHAWQAIDRLEECRVLCTLSLVCAEIAGYGESVIASTRAFELAQAAGSLPDMALALNRVGTARCRMGDHEQGLSCLSRALACAEQQGEANAILVALNNLSAGALLAHHDLEESGFHEEAAAAAQQAVSFARRAIAQAQGCGDPYRQAAVSCNLGEALGLGGDVEGALAAFAETEEISRERGFRPVVLRSRTAAGELLVRAGRLDEAVGHLRATLEWMRPNDPAMDRSRVHAALHHALKGQRCFEEALQHCEAALTLERRRATEQARTRAALMAGRSEVQAARLEEERARARSSELERRAVELEERASRDPLTGLGNRRLLERALQLLPAGGPAHIAVLDIDHFKQVNDRHGHAIGDMVLRELAALLQACLRKTDTAVRLGGEEFCLVLAPTSGEIANAVCERIRAAVEAANWEQVSPGLAVTASLGVAPWQGDAEGALKRADGALYAAKGAGRNRVCVAPAGA